MEKNIMIEFANIIARPHMQDKGVIDFIREWSDNMILERFGETVLENKDNILKDLNSINSILSKTIDGFSKFRYYHKEMKTVYYDVDYNYGTENPQFIGLSYVNIDQLMKEIQAA